MEALSSITGLLEFAISISLFYLVVSMVCASLTETISKFLNLRSRNLRNGLKSILGDPRMNSLAETLYKHSIIDAMSKPGKSNPSYIDARAFSSAVTDIVRSNNCFSNDVPIPNQLLNALWQESDKDIAKFQEKLAQHFDQAMERVSGWYKNSAQLISFWMAFSLAVVLNLNSIDVVKYFYLKPEARTLIVKYTEDNIKNLDPNKPEDVNKIYKELNSLTNLPIGWKVPDNVSFDTPFLEAASTSLSKAWNQTKSYGVIYSIIGWLLTAIAASKGADFWFNALNKLLSLRSGGKVPAPFSKP